jgi:hypothetical protein
MTLNARQRQRAMSWMLQQPGIRGVGVPADVYDKITPVANGIALPMWGRPASLEQIQFLADNDLTEPQQIHQAFGSLPHPHAPSVSVSEFPEFAHALQVFDEHK